MPLLGRPPFHGTVLSMLPPRPCLSLIFTQLFFYVVSLHIKVIIQDHRLRFCSLDFPGSVSSFALRTFAPLVLTPALALFRHDPSLFLNLNFPDNSGSQSEEAADDT